MTVVLVGAVGFILGLIAHDLGVQGLVDNEPLRPMVGICPRCRHHRGWLRLRCRSCGRRQGREPVLALAVAGAAVGFQNTVGITWVLVPYLAFLALTAALVVTDLEDFRIVDRLNLWGSGALLGVLAFVSLITGEGPGLVRGVVGGVLYFGGASLLYVIARGQGFGAGDVKLAFQLGLFTAFLSWTTLGRAVFTTAIIGGLVALGLIVFGKAGRKTELPYGPPMILGAWTAIILSGIGSGALGS